MTRSHYQEVAAGKKLVLHTPSTMTTGGSETRLRVHPHENKSAVNIMSYIFLNSHIFMQVYEMENVGS